MPIRVALTHRTHYSFDRRVGVAPHVVRLRPAPHCRTPIHRYSLNVEPAEHFINWQQDPFGNYAARLVFPEPVRELRFDVEVVADLTVINPFDFFIDEDQEHFPFTYSEEVARNLVPYLKVTEKGPLLTKWVKGVDLKKARTVDFLVGLNQRLANEVDYSVRMEPGVQTCEETLGRAIGSCRDSGWLLVQILRHLGIAARFVSGYLVQLRSDTKSLDGPSGPEADFTDLHAWAEAYLPGAGWVGLDPTSGLMAGEGHIPLACTPEPSDAAPITGATDKCEVTFDFSNTVTRIHEDPRVTLPYTESQWAAVDALGEAVDARLAANDVRLTMGGEPTFVSIDDMDGEEWNTGALGEAKWHRAVDLAGRLKTAFAPGGLMHFGQGKWYPGEQLPRWAITCAWRRDGEPLWNDPALLATGPDPVAGVPLESTTADAVEAAAALAPRIAAALGVDDDNLLPGYEDALYYLWREGRLPPELDPADESTGKGLVDATERARLRRILDGDLGRVVGHALPLVHDPDGWKSAKWAFRRGPMFLLPGDSPMGYRLPLDSLDLIDRVTEPERDPFEPREPLPRPVRQRHGESVDSEDEATRRHEKADAPHSMTALCVEARGDTVHVFLPPLERLESAVELLAAVESAARETGTPVRIEGYPLPEDERVRQFQVTPDPGVIEVNIHPSESWAELRDVTTRLHEEARLARLGTEKFMLDGRHTGTGGGNHVTLGASRPADSPLLRRPDVLASLINYWEHHPSLSYLFSGAFIGPTSQAPRADEARPDTAYELDIALAAARKLRPAGGECDRPWMVDRVLRNLLVDMTGNTHRSEFCIDKLYSPDSASGRRGLLELRAFEMPPHARMGLVQTLLVRSLMARFWEQPFDQPAARWGFALHDRFMLPHYVWSDLGVVMREMNAAGLPMDLAWFEPFAEFRFPRFGTVMVDDIELELRFAIEPWHVLGEESGGQGTARYVDSSVERLQVRATGLAKERHAILCNGRRVPLRSTGTTGEFVAGVRYKAWNPPSGLHPTVDVQAPLTFDIVDIANARAIGGCTYHVAHPAGRNYEQFPVNAAEAEARRVARFEAAGHTHGPMEVPPVVPNEDYPFTLDLRGDAGRVA